MERAGVAYLIGLYAAFFGAQLALVGVGLPVSVAILLRRGGAPIGTVAALLGTWRGRLTIALPLVLMLVVAPLPAAWGLVSAATAASLNAPWPVDGWIVYLTVIITSVGVLWLVVAFARLGSVTSTSSASATPAAHAAGLPQFAIAPPQGIGFVWEQGIRVLNDQLNTSDSLDRKIAPLVAAIIATGAIVVGQKETLHDFTGVLVLELAVAVTFLVLALVVRTFQTVPRLAAIAPYASASTAQLQLAFLGNLLQASASNDDALVGKTVLLNAAIASLFVFLGTGFVAALELAH